MNPGAEDLDGEIRRSSIPGETGRRLDNLPRHSLNLWTSYRVTPELLVGDLSPKRDYLDGVASEELRYRVFEPVSDVAVRCSGDLAVLRYRARIEIDLRDIRSVLDDLLPHAAPANALRFASGLAP